MIDRHKERDDPFQISTSSRTASSFVDRSFRFWLEQAAESMRYELGAEDSFRGQSRRRLHNLLRKRQIIWGTRPDTSTSLPLPTKRPCPFLTHYMFWVIGFGFWSSQTVDVHTLSQTPCRRDGPGNGFGILGDRSVLGCVPGGHQSLLPLLWDLVVDDKKKQIISTLSEKTVKERKKESEHRPARKMRML